MKIKKFQVDAFAGRVFEGTPAASCPLDSWLDDSLLQAIAEENNLPVPGRDALYRFRCGFPYLFRIWRLPVNPQVRYQAWLTDFAQQV